ncbi:BamA/TamA family outer membrane protein [Bacteroides sp. 519]|uniref:translocation and assembly module lipoprotein TamL n=1 Tax=Bacteroides sp. 519 TaxID=2302937 RepID=UPI00351A4071
MKNIQSLIAIALLLSSCSTTKNLDEGQMLYKGIKKTEIANDPKSAVGSEAIAEVKAALAKAPNGALFGSSSATLPKPLPIGLWIFNQYNDSQSKLSQWILKKFGSKPIYISTVNPGLRTQIATNQLRNYGFFNGTVSHTVNQRKDKKTADVSYFIDMKDPFFLDSIEYRNFSDNAMRIIMGGQGRRKQQLSENRSLLRKGAQFNVDDLENERQRISARLRNRGYYYFRPDFIGYQADTTRVHGLVDLRVQPKVGIPMAANKQWRIGDISVLLFGVNGEAPNDSTLYKNLTIHYHDKLQVRPKVLLNRIRMQSGQLYSQNRSTSTQERFAELGIFRYTEMQFSPKDSTATNNLLNLDIKTAFDLPYDSQLELNLATKSNDYAGPGATFTVTKKNIFRGGESLTVGIKGSYEWQTKSTPGASDSKINSYEVGLNASLNFPRIVFPHLGSKEWNFPATTTFSLNADLLNRANFFKMLAFGGNVTYNFQPTVVSKHSITPAKLTFNVLQSTTDTFKTIMDNNKALAQSMENQFIPAMNYTYTYDDMSLRRRTNRFWWQTSFTSAGNVTSAVGAIFGKKFSEEKYLLGSKMAQFIKLTSEIRYTWNIDKNQSVATRLTGGVAYAYGSNKTIPYTEQFFIGGANSIRAFTVRTIGPGSYAPDEVSRYSYLDRTGDIKMEANIEYRFRIIKDLHGAIFLDAGNVWLMRDQNNDHPGGKFTLKGFGNNIALGTGAGLRYDLSFLVIRLDCGVALHLPYETGKSGYYNIPKFKDGMGWHLAIGYPF